MTVTLAAVLAGTNARILEALPDGSAAEASLTPAALARPISGVGVDSRTAEENSLFVALPGERADGHDYVGAAFAAGATACLVSRIPEGFDFVPGDAAASSSRRYLLVAPDALGALQRLAAYWRTKRAVQVVGITGSVGKTTTKEIVASVLASRGPVLKSEANNNTEIGLPLTLLRLTPRDSAAILEMGMYGPGDIALLAGIARPDIGIVTNVAPVHLERMGSIERIARAKSELIAGLPPDALGILNGDDPWTRAMASVSGVCSSWLAGTGEDNHFRAVDIRSNGLEGTSFTVEAEGTSQAFEARVPGKHTVHAFLFAIAVARRLGMDWPDIQTSVAAVRLDARQRILRGPHGILIIDDTYNAAPLSVTAALEVLATAPGRKVAVLGDMLELGDQEEAAHRSIGARAARIADWLVVRGDRSTWIAEEALRCGLNPDRVIHTESNAEAAELVRDITARGDFAGSSDWSVLVKGSRGMRMEEVVDALRGEA